ncbi:MAG: ribosomal L7Ae/L30e/S12e/Gadd45 family protein [Candidatus Nanoarchaeia archaeon]
MAISDIEKAVKSDGLIIGFKNVVKSINEGSVKEIFVSANGKVFIDKLKLIAGKTPIKELSESSKDLGVKCKKPFNISVLGLKSEGKK